MLYSLRLLQLQMNMGWEEIPSGPSEAILSTLRFPIFPEMGKSFMQTISRFLEDKVFFWNKLEIWDFFKLFVSVNQLWFLNHEIA